MRLTHYLTQCEGVQHNGCDALKVRHDLSLPKLVSREDVFSRVAERTSGSGPASFFSLTPFVVLTLFGWLTNWLARAFSLMCGRIGHQKMARGARI